MLEGLAWLYAVTGSAYFMMFITEASDADFIHRDAVGPFYVVMFISPVVLMVLIVVTWILPILNRRYLNTGLSESMASDEIPQGWVKPVRPRTAAEVEALIKERKREVAALELELFNLQQGPRLEALAKIRNIMRAQQLTVEDICIA